MVLQSSSKLSCPRCGKNSIVTDAEIGESACKICGFVISERIADTGPEWRSFPQDKANKSRTGDGTSLTRHDSGLTTIINPANLDFSGRALSSAMKTDLKRLRVWDNRTMAKGPSERNLRIAFSELGIIKDKLALSNAIAEKAAYIYRKALEKKLVKGRSISALMCATLYAACREAGTPRTLKDFSQSADIKKRSIAVCYRMLVKELDLKMPVVDSVQNVARIASKVGLSEKTKRHAIKILKKAEQTKISAGKNPMSLAATALYLSCIKMGENYSQRDLAEAANVTEVTIRNRIKGLKLLEV